MARFVKRHVPVASSVLELGCGAGANLFWLANNGYLPWGIDVSASAIERIKDRTPYHAMAVVGDVTEMIDWENNGFECVVDVCCLQHVRDVDAALKEAYRVLKPNGWLFSVWAAEHHSNMAFPNGIYTRKLIDGVEAFYLLRNQGFEEIKTYRSSYEDEVYGRIEHWLVQGQKLTLRG